MSFSQPLSVSSASETPNFSSFTAAVKVTLDKPGSDPSSSVFSSLRDTMPGGTGRQTIIGGGSTPSHTGNKAFHLSGSDSLSGSDGLKFSVDGVKYTQDHDGKFTTQGSSASDSIFGGTAHDVVPVKVAMTGPDVSSTDHVTTITFSGGQSSQAESVKVVFNDHSKPH